MVSLSQSRLLLRAHGDRARLVATRGLGHRRILKDPAVVAEAVEFVTAPAVETPGSEWRPAEPAVAARGAGPASRGATRRPGPPAPVRRRRTQPRRDAPLGAVVRPGVVEQHRVRVGRLHQGDHLEGRLLHVQVRHELPGGTRLRQGPLHVRGPLPAGPGDGVVDRARTGVELGGDREEEAAAREDPLRGVREPVPAQRAHPRHPGGTSRRGDDRWEKTETAALTVASWSSSLEPKRAKTPLLLRFSSVAIRPRDRPSRPSTEAMSIVRPSTRRRVWLPRSTRPSVFVPVPPVLPLMPPSY